MADTTERMILGDVLRLLRYDDEGPLQDYRTEVLLWSLLTEQVAPAEIRRLLFAADVSGIDDLIFDRG